MSSSASPGDRPGLKISELAAAAGVSAGTIKHYLREGLLEGGHGIVRTSRNMAWYPPEYVDRVRLIKRLQEQRFLPLALIKELLAGSPPRAAVDPPANVLDRLAELGVLTGDADRPGPEDVAIVAAIARLRGGGHEEALGFTLDDALRYRDALRPLAERTARALAERLGDAGPDRAAALLRAGLDPLHDLIGALHAKLVLEELRRVTGAAPPEGYARGSRD